MKKVSDGLYLMYVKNGVMYPVVMTDEEWNMLQISAHAICRTIKVLDKPLGEAFNLK
jgi:hypothetical protein